MKILHTADWHLGNVFHRHGREEEHRHFLQWLLNVLTDEQPDALFIAGDVFDHANPSAAAERQLYDFLIHATQQVEGLQVVLIAGNHDGAARLEGTGAILVARGVARRGASRNSARPPPCHSASFPFARPRGGPLSGHSLFAQL